jgi:hypothetical protein
MRRLAPRIALALALVASAQPSVWAKLGATVGGAIGGSQKPGRRGTDHTLERKFRAERKALGDAPRLTLQSAGQNVGYLDGNHYKNVRDVGLALLQKYAPDKHYFIGVGRSPVALVTFLRELNDDMAMTFPASDMRLQIQPAWRKDYFAHFAALIPESVLRGDRTIVLFDRTREGKTLVRLRRTLQAYLRSIGSKTEVRVIGLSPHKPTVSVNWMDTSAYPHLFKYAQGQFDHDEAVAPFTGKHRIGVNAVDDLRPNPNHQRFRNEMRARMAEDAALDGVLAKDFKEHLR